MSGKTFVLGDCEVAIESEHTVTRFPDGTYVWADHAVQPGQIQLASEYQMTATEMNRTHDLVHNLLAIMLGLNHSPTLNGVAHKDTEGYYPWWWVEERAVLAVQAYAKVAGVDLEALAAKVSNAQHPQSDSTGDRPGSLHR